MHRVNCTSTTVHLYTVTVYTQATDSSPSMQLPSAGAHTEKNSDCGGENLPSRDEEIRQSNCHAYINCSADLCVSSLLALLTNTYTSVYLAYYLYSHHDNFLPLSKLTIVFALVSLYLPFSLSIFICGLDPERRVDRNMGCHTESSSPNNLIS